MPYKLIDEECSYKIRESVDSQCRDGVASFAHLSLAVRNLCRRLGLFYHAINAKHNVMKGLELPDSSMPSFSCQWWKQVIEYKKKKTTYSAMAKWLLSASYTSHSFYLRMFHSELQIVWLILWGRCLINSRQYAWHYEEGEGIHRLMSQWKNCLMITWKRFKQILAWNWCLLQCEWGFVYLTHRYYSCISLTTRD